MLRGREDADGKTRTMNAYGGLQQQAPVGFDGAG